MSWIGGIHHVTGAATDGQKDHDFYTSVLGLRLVKKTINHETADQWHLFYGDQAGRPGTVMTNFIFEGSPLRRYRRGRGCITEVAYAVPVGSFPFWRSRFAAAGLPVGPEVERFGEQVLPFADPSGIPSELVATADHRPGEHRAGLSPDVGVRGFHSVTLLSRLPELTLDFFLRLFRFREVGREGNRIRLATGENSATFVDLLRDDSADWGHWGLGGLHHVAFLAANKQQMELLWRVLSGEGLIVTDLRDRKWFHSMYFTEPGGINLEVSDLSPGWLVDEPAETLGTALCLPKQWEASRRQIEGSLPSLSFVS